MPYSGKTIMGRVCVSLVAPHWPNDKTRAVAAAGAESHLSLGSWHDNLAGSPIKLFHRNDPVLSLAPSAEHLEYEKLAAAPAQDGTIRSRDCGLFQINIGADEIGGPREGRLRTESLLEADWMDVARENVREAYELWARRKWQPWVAVTTGWAWFPEAWAWHHDADGKPVGPWVPTGRYLHMAIRAVANWHLLIEKDLGIGGAVDEAMKLADHFGVTKGDLLYDERHGVYWKFPLAPTRPPTGPPWGYPVRNDGQ